jgi:cold shock CspA family protein
MIMTCTGTVSDFDRAGLFGLIIADDGGFLLFNLRETPPEMRSRFETGTRVRFARQASEPAERAVELAPIVGSHDSRPSTVTTPKK